MNLQSRSRKKIGTASRKQPDGKFWPFNPEVRSITQSLASGKIKLSLPGELLRPKMMILGRNQNPRSEGSFDGPAGRCC